MKSDAYVHVTCDKCQYDHEYELTACVQKSWDERGLAKKLEKDGWVVDGDCHYCESCKDEPGEEVQA